MRGIRKWTKLAGCFCTQEDRSDLCVELCTQLAYTMNILMEAETKECTAHTSAKSK